MNLKEAILDRLLQTPGKANAITGGQLARMFGYCDDRPIRLLIRELIEDGYPIAASTGKGGGYFLIQTREEAQEYMSVLKGRLCEDAYRRTAFRIAAGRYLEPSRQLNMSEASLEEEKCH